MGYDSKGVERGRCTRCTCEDFTTKSVKCHCGHAPIHHLAISSQRSHGHVNVHGHSPAGESARKLTYSEIVTNNTTPSASVSKPILVSNPVHNKGAKNQSLHDPKQRYCYTCSSMYVVNVGACPSCYPRGDCENAPCTNMKYYDVVYGPFSYCSPSCRDQHLLPGYNRKLREHLSSNISLPVVNDDINAVATEMLVVSTGTCGVANKTQITPQESGTRQHTHIKTPPKCSDEVYYYHEKWNEGDKTGLYVTGLALGMDVELELGDLIFGAIPRPDFTEYSNYAALTGSVTSFMKVKVYRKHDFSKVHDRINKDVKNVKNKKIFAFFLPYKQEGMACGIECKEIEKKVIISSLDKDTAAGNIGLQESDVVLYIGGVKKDEIDKFTLIKLKDKEHFVRTFTTLKESPSTIGFVLITERNTSSRV